jgi:uncharacterized protein YkwD
MEVPRRPSRSDRIIIVNGSGNSLTADAGLPGGGTTDGAIAPAPDVGTPPPPPQPPTPDSGPPPGSTCGHTAIEQQVFVLLNQARAQKGLQPYTCDPFAVQAARGHSQDMCDKKYFSHTGLDGSSPSSRLKAAGATFSYSGENIAWGYPTPQAVHNGWMGSWGHRKAMLSPTFQRVGIGHVLCNGKTSYWTENFLQ